MASADARHTAATTSLARVGARSIRLVSTDMSPPLPRGVCSSTAIRTGAVVLVWTIGLLVGAGPRTAACGLLLRSGTEAMLRRVSSSISANTAPMSKAIAASVISAVRLGRKVCA